MPTLKGNGTQVAVISTEHTIFDSTENKEFRGYIDTTNMQSGDSLEVKVYIKINSLGSLVRWTNDLLENVQVDPLYYVPPLSSDLQFRVTITQTQGTGRSYDYRFYGD